jgi:hypothetical protein
MKLVCTFNGVRGKGVESSVDPRNSRETYSGVLSRQPISISLREDRKVFPFSLNTACFLGNNKYNKNIPMWGKQ